MFNICLFCELPFTKLAIEKQIEIEGHQVTHIICPNCGAEFKVTVVIQRGPTRSFVKNGPSKNKPAEGVKS